MAEFTSPWLHFGEEKPEEQGFKRSETPFEPFEPSISGEISPKNATASEGEQRHPFVLTAATVAEMADVWLLSGCPGSDPVLMGMALLHLKLRWKPRDRGTTKRQGH